MYFNITYKKDTYRYHLNFFEGNKGLVVKSKLNGVEKTHYVQSSGKKYVVAKAPKDLVDANLLVMYRTSEGRYKIQYPINMNEGDWDKFSFSVEDGKAYSQGVSFKNLEVGKVNFDSYWGFWVPVGVSRIDIP